MFGHSEQLNLSAKPTSSNPNMGIPITEQIQVVRNYEQLIIQGCAWRGFFCFVRRFMEISIITLISLSVSMFSFGCVFGLMLKRD
ncbi:hypothetical protein TCT1_27020 [Xenorhabdus sp. TCT-1]|uniref:Uncharacterized protein n=1 Tax=Xenorhabdus taiwanensis TaxID=3085177 RepID=A0ABN7C5W7_9GAMM|nr:hypothetical protein TCT1_27020 [Xenorhabdus sp. TCT-1]